MFKKKESVVLAPAHLVSGADRKKLARRLEALSGMPAGITPGTIPHTPTYYDIVGHIRLQLGVSSLSAAYQLRSFWDGQRTEFQNPETAGTFVPCHQMGCVMH